MSTETMTPARHIDRDAMVLHTVIQSHSATAESLGRKCNLGRGPVLAALRRLSARGFVFCNDDFDGRERKPGGQFSNALWCVNYEASPKTTLDDCRSGVQAVGHGADIMRSRGLGC